MFRPNSNSAITKRRWPAAGRFTGQLKNAPCFVNRVQLDGTLYTCLAYRFFFFCHSLYGDRRKERRGVTATRRALESDPETRGVGQRPVGHPMEWWLAVFIADYDSVSRLHCTHCASAMIPSCRAEGPHRMHRVYAGEECLLN